MFRFFVFDSIGTSLDLDELRMVGEPIAGGSTGGIKVAGFSVDVLIALTVGFNLLGKVLLTGKAEEAEDFGLMVVDDVTVVDVVVGGLLRGGGI